MTEGILGKTGEFIKNMFGPDAEKASHIENCSKGAFGNYGENCPRCIQLQMEKNPIPTTEGASTPLVNDPGQLVQVSNETTSPERIKLPTEKSPPTSPWNQGGNRWHRDLVGLVKKRPGFRPRFVHPRNFERNLAIGYQFADVRDYGGLSDRIVGEEKQLDTKVRRREMVLMEIPEDTAKERDEYYAHRANKSEQSIKQAYVEDGRKAGVPTYVPAGVNPIFK